MEHSSEISVRACQGNSAKSGVIADVIPAIEGLGVLAHGATLAAAEIIAKDGLSRQGRLRMHFYDCDMGVGVPNADGKSTRLIRSDYRRSRGEMRKYGNSSIPCARRSDPISWDTWHHTAGVLFMCTQTTGLRSVVVSNRPSSECAKRARFPIACESSERRREWTSAAKIRGCHVHTHPTARGIKPECRAKSRCTGPRKINAKTRSLGR